MKEIVLSYGTDRSHSARRTARLIERTYGNNTVLRSAEMLGVGEESPLGDPMASARAVVVFIDEDWTRPGEDGLRCIDDPLQQLLERRQKSPYGRRVE